MDEEYTDSVDASADMDISDMDITDDISLDIPDNVPEDIPGNDYFEADISEDIPDETIDDNSNYEEIANSFEEDSVELEDVEINESIEDFSEDSYEDLDEVSEIDEEFDDIPEDVDETEADSGDENIDVEEIPEDIENELVIDQEETFEDDVSEDVAGTNVTDGAIDIENADVAKQLENGTDADATEEVTDVGDVDIAERLENMNGMMEGITDAEDTDISEKPKDMIDTDVAEVVEVKFAEQPENMIYTDTVEETTGVEDVATIKPEDEDHRDLETYDYETSPETKNVVTPEMSGEFVFDDNLYRERRETFSEEFSHDEKESKEWDSLKDALLSKDEQLETGGITENESVPEDIQSAIAEVNSISDYMNEHNYGFDDFATYSQDPQWRQLMRQEYPDYELPEMSQESANAQLSRYMNDHNYGADDYAEYSQDPIWRELHSTAFPDDELPALNYEFSEQDMRDSVSESDDDGNLNFQSNNHGGEYNPTHNPDDIIEEELFGSFETDKHINGYDLFIKGDNYEQFKKDYYNPEESTYKAYDTPKEVDISPSAIEGIHISEREMENPSIFWSQHEDGTLESFKQIATKIPDVREQLASGKTMDELLDDPELSKCAGIYFANKPKVIENKGYYEFDSNGRHRILAARETGYDIPVEVIGQRSRTEIMGHQSSNDTEVEFNTKLETDSSIDSIRDDKEVKSFADKVHNFFSLPKNIDSAETGISDTFEPVGYIQEKWTPPPIKGVDVKEPIADIMPLDVTRQTINIMDLPDGTRAKVFDHPSDLQDLLPFSQGNNEFSKSGTCALADTGSWLKIAGSKNVENDVVGFASTHMDRQGRPLCSKSGGTLPSNIPFIWEHFGIPAYSDGSKNLESIAEAVESGRAVSVGVNAGTLWEQDNIEGYDLSHPVNNCYGDGGANHAVGVMSCERDSNSGTLTHFYINDTGRGLSRDACRRISIGDFGKAFNVGRGTAIISKKPVW